MVTEKTGREMEFRNLICSFAHDPFFLLDTQRGAAISPYDDCSGYFYEGGMPLLGFGRRIACYEV